MWCPHCKKKTPTSMIRYEDKTYAVICTVCLTHTDRQPTMDDAYKAWKGEKDCEYIVGDPFEEERHEIPGQMYIDDLLKEEQ